MLAQFLSCKKAKIVIETTSSLTLDSHLRIKSQIDLIFNMFFYSYRLFLFYRLHPDWGDSIIYRNTKFIKLHLGYI